MDCSLPGSSARGIFQARVLEWGAIAFSETEFLSPNKKKRESRPNNKNMQKFPRGGRAPGSPGISAVPWVAELSPALEGRRPQATLQYRQEKLWVRQRVPKYRRKFLSKETTRKEKVASENFWKLKMLISNSPPPPIPAHTFHSEQDDRS